MKKFDEYEEERKKKSEQIKCLQERVSSSGKQKWGNRAADR